LEKILQSNRRSTQQTFAFDASAAEKKAFSRTPSRKLFQVRLADAAKKKKNLERAEGLAPSPASLCRKEKRSESRRTEKMFE